MANYIKVLFRNIRGDQSEVLIALLENIGYDGFEEVEDALIAYIEQEKFDAESLAGVASQNNIAYSTSIEQQQNWNAVWESDFQPVIIGDFVAIRADFHQQIDKVAHEIIITPKMSFGTGHHATTSMMIEQMKKLDFTNKTVFDFGTGTGILAILAEKLGASVVVALDNDEWSITNAEENFSKNNCKLTVLMRKDNAELQQHFDIILANINKNVIIENLPSLIKQLNNGGCILFSGLLKEDEEDIISQLAVYNAHPVHTQSKGNWISVLVTA